MKRVVQGTEPPALAKFRTETPKATWDQLRQDRTLYDDIRRALVGLQRGLCAYCEIDIRDNDPLKCRVEHFHPKSDTAASQNWSLTWNNLLGVCSGGSRPEAAAPGFYLAPTDDNLSCDAHKDRMIQRGRLALDCDGWILDPRQVPAFPSLVRVHWGTGAIEPMPAACGPLDPWPGNRHDSVEALVACSIRMLNLNCDRLTRQRLVVLRDIERQVKRLRNSTGTMADLALRHFQPECPAFFSTRRARLGPAAEAHLRAISFVG